LSVQDINEFIAKKTVIICDDLRRGSMLNIRPSHHDTGFSTKIKDFRDIQGKVLQFSKTFSHQNRGGCLLW
jgi:hypothetical protein